MSQNLVVTAPYLDLLGAGATGWARGFGITRSATVQEARYADQSAVRRAAGIASYGLTVNVDAETSTHEASAALWGNVGTAGALAGRASTAVVGASNPSYESVGDATAGVFCSELSLTFNTDENAGVSMNWAVDGAITRETT